MNHEGKKFERISTIFKALAHPLRIEILYFLRDGEKSVQEIEKATKTTQSNISQHLNKMKDKRVLISRKEANFIYYRLYNKNILNIVDILANILDECI